MSAIAEALERLSAAHAAYFKKPALAVRFDPGTEGLQDALFVYGVLGAKDVGKSTFLEALVGEPVNREKQGLNRGTDEVVAFLHESAQAAFRARLQSIGSAAFRFLDGWNADPIGAGGPVPVRVFAHRRADLAGVIFLDLPDFSSIFEEHLRILDSVSPALNGFLWLTSTNYNLQAFSDMVRAQNKSTGNYYYLVNKIDLIAEDYGRGQLEPFRARVAAELAKMVPKTARVEVCLVSARHPKEYDLPALRARLVREHDAKEIEEAKRRNVTDGFSKVSRELEEYYGVERLRKGIDAVIEDIPTRVEQELPEAYRDRVARRVLDDDEAIRRLRSRYFAHCARKWPILRTLHLLLAPIAGWAGRRFADAMADASEPRGIEAIATLEGRGLAERVAAAQGAVREAHWEVHRTLAESKAAAASGEPLGVGREVLALVAARDAEIREETLDAAKEAYRGPGRLMRLFVLLPILWFPFLQPVLEAALTLWSERGAVRVSRVLLIAVQLLGTTHVIKSLAVLAMVYVLFLIGLSARCNARIIAARSMPLLELWQERLPALVSERLSRPYIEAREEVQGMQRGLSELTRRLGLNGA